MKLSHLFGEKVDDPIHGWYDEEIAKLKKIIDPAISGLESHRDLPLIYYMRTNHAGDLAIDADNSLEIFGNNFDIDQPFVELDGGNGAKMTIYILGGWQYRSYTIKTIVPVIPNQEVSVTFNSSRKILTIFLGTDGSGSPNCDKNLISAILDKLITVSPCIGYSADESKRFKLAKSGKTSFTVNNPRNETVSLNIAGENVLLLRLGKTYMRASHGAFDSHSTGDVANVFYWGADILALSTIDLVQVEY